MGKNKERKKFNYKARSQPDPSKRKVAEVVDAVDVDFNYDAHKFDASNALVLTIKKDDKDGKDKLPRKKKVKPLSRKDKKRLQKVLEKKKKKIDRVQIIDELQKFQIPTAEYNAMASASLIQTRGLKRHFQIVEAQNNQPEADPQTLAQLYKSGKKFKAAVQVVDDVVVDPNVVQYRPEESSSSESDEGDDDSFSETEKTSLDMPSSSGTSAELAVTSQAESTEASQTLHASDLPVDPLPESIVVDSTPAIYEKLDRKPEIEINRRKLPVVAEEQAIMEAIRYNNVVIICGETGSGKTTQVPQFLYEAGYARDKIIGVTEPRRVAATSMSRRIGEEMNLPEAVSYHIRYENNITDKTKMKFMTDGVLLREVQKDFLLSDYSAIIVDEAHERSVFSDILIGLLSRIVPLREKKGNPLKLIIMSATLRIDDFTENKKLFKSVPPIIKIDSRQFPVSVHFAKVTPEDHIQAAFSKVCKIHREEASGGILVFVTGKQEVNVLCRKLKRLFPGNHQPAKGRAKSEVAPVKISETPNPKTEDVPQKKSKDRIISDMLPKFNLDDYKELPEARGEEDDDVDADASDGDFALSDDDEDDSRSKQPLYCLPLYSNLPKNKQDAVFRSPPKGYRLCVVATNVAETSLTIPDVKYVIDTGKVKTKVYDKTTGISAFVVDWCSKASCDQRAGRAGRTSAGHCYRLYSSAVFNDKFVKFSEPEIVRKPIDDLLLQMKALNIDNVINFPYPSPPSQEALIASEDRLVLMEALEPVRRLRSSNSKARPLYKLTSLGRAMSHFPISPRYSKMLAFAYKELFPYVIAIISGLTVQEIFLSDHVSDELADTKTEDALKLRRRKEQWHNLRRKWASNGNEKQLGDLTLMLKAIGSSEFTGCSPAFCEQNGLRHKAMVEIHKLRKQITHEVNHAFGREVCEVNGALKPPSDLEAKHLRQIAAAGFFDHVARRIPENEKEKNDKTMRHAYKVEAPVFMESSSVLKDEKPEFVVYQEIHETSKMFMRNIVVIEPEWLPIYAVKLCNLSKPLEEPAPFYDEVDDCVKCYRTATFGPYQWPVPQTEHVYPDGIDKFRWFARFLLEGKIDPYFQLYSKTLLSPPTILNKSWSKLQPRTTSMIDALSSEDVDSLKKLSAKWIENPTYLLKEFKQWTPSESHSTIELNWPPNKKLR